MKKALLIIAAVIAVLAVIFCSVWVGSGFFRIKSAFIEDFTVSEDGSEMNIRIMLASSIGYVRKVTVHEKDDGKLLLDCYSAFGGINGSIGAKRDYVIPLPEDAKSIAVYGDAGDGSGAGYEVVLQKDENGDWKKVIH